jgi:glycosyltransferase involved in cell wall biosynthesis
MNILVFSWRGPKHPLAGGAEQVMHEHMKGWIAAGHRVVLFTSYFQGSLKKERLDGVEIIRKGNQILEVHLAAFFWYVLGKHEKFDLVIDQFHGIPFFTPFYVRISKLAVLQEVARKVWLKNDLPTPFNRIVGTVGYLSEPLIFLFYKKIFFMTGSQSAKTDLVSMGISSNKIVIVPHGVVVEKPRSTPKKEKKETIMFLGALAKDKGIEDALKVFSILNKKGSFQFWIVGRAGKPYLKYLKSLVKKLGLGKAIKFFGFVSQKRKFELLARTHILINPSILEGFGLVNIEANAMGTPVVAYKSRGLIDSVKHNRSVKKILRSQWQMKFLIY